MIKITVMRGTGENQYLMHALTVDQTAGVASRAITVQRSEGGAWISPLVTDASGPAIQNDVYRAVGKLQHEPTHERLIRHDEIVDDIFEYPAMMSPIMRRELAPGQGIVHVDAGAKHYEAHGALDEMPEGFRQVVAALDGMRWHPLNS